MATRNKMTTKPTIDRRLWRKRYMPRRHSSMRLWFRARQPASPSWRGAPKLSVAMQVLHAHAVNRNASSITDPWIQHAVQHIDEEVYKHEGKPDHQGDTHDRLEIRDKRRLDRVEADARPIKDRFDQH